MNTKGIKIYSDLDQRYTELLTLKILQYSNNIFGNLNSYDKYIKVIELKKETSNYNITKEEDGYFDASTKKIRLTVNKNILLVYENLFHQMQHAQNNIKNIFNLKAINKYPLIYTFIDKYLAYSLTMNYMINKEFIKNQKLLTWYIRHVSNKNNNSNLEANIKFLKDICSKDNSELSCDNDLNDILNDIAFSIAKINILKINNFNIKLSPLIIELDKMKSPITIKECKDIQYILDII